MAIVLAQSLPPRANAEYTAAEAPKHIAEAFVQAYSGADVDALASLYADSVDHTNSGLISNAAVRAQAKEYFTRWPVRQWSLVGSVKAIALGATKQNVIFSASYVASDPQTNKHASGIAQETLILATDLRGAMKIVSQKEQTSKRSSSASAEKTSEAPWLNAAKAEYEHSSYNEAARVRYVTKLAAMLGEGMEYWWRTHDKMGGPNLDGVAEELVKHPAPGNVDSRELSQLLVGNWLSSRHVYEFRADGTYGVGEEQRDKWRIEGNEYIDDVSRGKIILIDDKYFVYAEGQGVAFYLRAKDPEAEPHKPSDLAIKQKLVGYWKFPKAVCYIAADGKMHVGPRKNETEASSWDVRDGKFYWSNVPYTIVTLNDKEFVFREIGSGQKTIMTLIRSTKEEVDPE